KDGRVLVVGGLGLDVSSSAELYDPQNGMWTETGSTVAPRYYHTATLLPDGKVLVTGGVGTAGGIGTASAELYDPATGTWRATTSLSAERLAHTATLLSDGKVLVVGGLDHTALASAEVYDPTSET